MAAAVTAVQDDYETTELRGSDSTAHVDHIYTSTSIHAANDTHTEKLDKSDTKVKAWVIVVGELYYLQCSVGG